MRPEFKILAKRIVRDAKALSDEFLKKKFTVVTGGTDNHIVVIDVRSLGLTGIVAEKALESCGIIVNKNRIPHDPQSPFVTSGIRLGTNTLARRGLEPEEMPLCADLIERVLNATTATGEREFELSGVVQESVQKEVKEICIRHPVEEYVLESEDAVSPDKKNGT